MGDLAELRELVGALVEETERLSLESARREAERVGELDRLIAALMQRPVVVCCCKRDFHGRSDSPRGVRLIELSGPRQQQKLSSNNIRCYY